MTEVEKSAEFILNHTNMSIIAFNEPGSDEVASSMNGNYSDLIGLTAYLIYNAHVENGLPLEAIRADLDQAVYKLKEALEEEDNE
jgi:hypothetical protein